MIRHNSGVPEKNTFLSLILKWFFLYENFVWSLIFKLQEEIVSLYQGRVEETSRSGG